MILVSLLLFAGVTLNTAQALPTTRPEIGQRLKENAEKLQQYTYKRKLEITIKDHTIQREELVHYVDGKMESVPLETPQRAGMQPQASGLRGRIIRKKIEKKKEEAQENVEQLKELLKQYSPSSPSLRSALEKANISRTSVGSESMLKVEAKGVVQPADSFTLTWNLTAKRPQSIEIQSALNKKPVQMMIDYASLPNGLFYPERTVLRVPKKNLVVRIETFDYSASAQMQ